MNHPEIFFRTEEFEKIKSDYYSKKEIIDNEVDIYFANTNNMEELYLKVNRLENSDEILRTFRSNMVQLKNDPISAKSNWSPTAGAFSYSTNSIDITNSKSVFHIGLVVLVIFLLAAIKKWKIRKFFQVSLIILIAWNAYNYGVKEPEFLAKSEHFINETEYRNNKMAREANSKLKELYEPPKSNYSRNTYEYEVEGTDIYGNYVTGNIETSERYGDGYIIDKSFKTINIEVEWISNGKLLGTDDNGNEYELRIKN